MENSNNNPPIETKISRVFSALMEGLSFNRFEAEHQLHDHCLHSTISDIQKRYGIEVSRVFETVPCLQGMATTRCKRYWIALEELIRYERRQVNIRKQKTQTTSVETKGMGCQMYTEGDIDSVNNSQAGLNIGA